MIFWNSYELAISIDALEWMITSHSIERDVFKNPYLRPVFRISYEFLSINQIHGVTRRVMKMGDRFLFIGEKGDPVTICIKKHIIKILSNIAHRGYLRQEASKLYYDHTENGSHCRFIWIIIVAYREHVLLCFAIPHFLLGTRFTYYYSMEWIVYPFPNTNSSSVEVWEWINNLFLPFIMDVITYSCWDYS